MDPHPERASDPVTEENIFQFLHLPSEHRRDCMDTAGLELLTRLLFADQHLQNS